MQLRWRQVSSNDSAMFPCVVYTEPTQGLGLASCCSTCVCLEQYISVSVLKCEEEQVHKLYTRQRPLKGLAHVLVRHACSLQCIAPSVELICTFYIYVSRVGQGLKGLKSLCYYVASKDRCFLYRMY